MIRKFFFYIKSGGITEVYKYTVIKLKKLIYYKSETIFYFLDREIHFKEIEKRDISFMEIKNDADFKKIKFGRIKTLSYKEWFKKGSFAIVGFNASTPVSYTWTHFNYHIIKGVGKIELSTNQCWVGPSFVNKSMRRKRINQAQHQFQIKNAPVQIRYFLTSVNEKNYASRKSLEKVGFKVGVKVVKYFGILSNKKTTIKYFVENKSLFQLHL